MNPNQIYDDAPLLLKDYLFYLNTVTAKSPKTVYEYYLDIRMFLRFLKLEQNQKLTSLPFDEIPYDDVDADFLNEISLSDAYKFLNFLATDRNNISTSRSRKVSSIKGFFKFLNTKTGLEISNPFENLEMPNIKKTLPKYLSLEESLEVLNVIEGANKERDYLMFTLFLNCGMRLAELVSLDINDIKGNQLKVLGKGNKERVVYLNDACIAAIDDYLAVRPETGAHQKALFISRNANRISRRRVQQIVDENFIKAGLEDQNYSTHKLRHTAATLMYQHGDVDIRVLKEILGHENISTTEIYTHVANKQLEKAASKSPLSNVKRNKKK